MPITEVRHPAVAGQFYPADPDELEALIESYLSAAETPEDSLDPPLVKAVIVPHAGYIYSGPIAASAYVNLAFSDIPIRRFILLGPAHFVPVNRLAISGARVFATPLGVIPIDESARAAALKLPQVGENDLAHQPEHSLEVQLPFLQVLCPDFTIVPLLVGNASPIEVAEVLDHLWDGPETRIIISSDLSHYHDYKTARQMDQKASDAITALDGESLEENSACGRTAIQGLLLAARRRKMRVTAVNLRNSGDTGGPRDRVVGYGAFIFVEEAAAAY
ncbi:MAG: AmmeMemoRadiSam system protein B [Chloroflexota bacterium]|jgi:MEMO1 family protein